MKLNLLVNIILAILIILYVVILARLVYALSPLHNKLNNIQVMLLELADLLEVENIEAINKVNDIQCNLQKLYNVSSSKSLTYYNLFSSLDPFQLSCLLLFILVFCFFLLSDSTDTNKKQ